MMAADTAEACWPIGLDASKIRFVDWQRDTFRSFCILLTAETAFCVSFRQIDVINAGRYFLLHVHMGCNLHREKARAWAAKGKERAWAAKGKERARAKGR
jgi:hypothetical protein